jgi:SagB-type dehydrogenase family enzyme
VYGEQAHALTELSQLLWAAQGVTHRNGLRTAPSVGALYPLEVYVAIGEVEGLQDGVYRYEPASHSLLQLVPGDFRGQLSRAALDQEAVTDGALVSVITAVYERTTWKYGARGERYVHMEVGSAAQNVYLQAVSLDLGTVFIGAFDDGEVRKILALADEEQPLCLLPVGRLTRQ